MSQQLPPRPAPFVMRWNRRWISGERFARDYATGVLTFTSEVAQAVTRVRGANLDPALSDAQTHAAAWAAVLVAFEAASFREQDRETLLALLLEELRPSWGETANVLQRSEAYFAMRDNHSPSKTAERIVGWYLRALGMPERVGTSAIARHLRVNFSHRILRDIYRLSAASRLRTAVISLIERQRAARIADIDLRGAAIWSEPHQEPTPEIPALGLRTHLTR